MQSYETLSERSTLPECNRISARGTRADENLISNALGGGLVVPDLTDWLEAGEVVSQPFAPPIDLRERRNIREEKFPLKAFPPERHVAKREEQHTSVYMADGRETAHVDELPARYHQGRYGGRRGAPSSKSSETNSFGDLPDWSNRRLPDWSTNATWGEDGGFTKTTSLSHKEKSAPAGNHHPTSREGTRTQADGVRRREAEPQDERRAGTPREGNRGIQPPDDSPSNRSSKNAGSDSSKAKTLAQPPETPRVKNLAQGSESSVSNAVDRPPERRGGHFLLGTKDAPKGLRKVNMPAAWWDEYEKDLEGLSKRERYVHTHADLCALFGIGLDNQTGLAPISFDKVLVPFFGSRNAASEASKKLSERRGFKRTGYVQPKLNCHGWSRSFGPTPERLNRLKAMRADAALSDGEFINVFKGSPSTAKFKTLLSDRHNHTFPDLIQKELTAFKDLEVKANINMAERVLRKRQGRARAACRDCFGVLPRSEKGALLEALEEPGTAKAWGVIGGHLSRLRKKGEEVPEELRTAESRFSRYQNDAKAIEILKHQETRREGDFLWYKPAIGVQRFGRLSERGVALQSCSRPMKRALTYRCEYLNVDLSAAHDRWLPEMMREAGFDPSWMEWYLELDQKKTYAAKQVGIERRTWKAVLKSIYNGASVDAKGKDVRKDLEKDSRPGAVEDKVRRLKELFCAHGGAPFHTEVRAFVDWQATEWLEDAQYDANGKKYIKNAVGQTLCVSDLMDHKLKTSLTAFRLQGREQKLIMTLSQRLRAGGYTVASNQHDGLLIDARRTDWEEILCLFNASRRAVAETSTKLEIKSICEKAEWRELMGGGRADAGKGESGSPASPLYRRFHESYEMDPDRGCWLGSASGARGYPRLWTGNKMVYAHRYSWKLHRGTRIPSGMVVRHLCHEPRCMNPDHLALGSYKENMLDMTKAGRHAGKDGEGKLNPQRVREIRRRADRGAVQKELAREYSCSKQTISDVVRRKTWDYVK